MTESELRDIYDATHEATPGHRFAAHIEALKAVQRAVLYEAADTMLDQKRGIPFDAIEDRATVSAWTQEWADDQPQVTTIYT